MGRATHDVSAAMPTPHYGRLRVDFSPHQIPRCLRWKEAKQKIQAPGKTRHQAATHRHGRRYRTGWSLALGASPRHLFHRTLRGTVADRRGSIIRSPPVFFEKWSERWNRGKEEGGAPAPPSENHLASRLFLLVRSVLGLGLLGARLHHLDEILVARLLLLVFAVLDRELRELQAFLLLAGLKLGNGPGTEHA